MKICEDVRARTQLGTLKCALDVTTAAASTRRLADSLRRKFLEAASEVAGKALASTGLDVLYQLRTGEKTKDEEAIIL